MTILTTMGGFQLIRTFKEGDTEKFVIISWQISTIILMAIELLKIICLVMLIVWHIFIQRLGISTYQFLVEKEQLDICKGKLKRGEITQE